jgi:hypothetical protein
MGMHFADRVADHFDGAEESFGDEADNAQLAGGAS